MVLGRQLQACREPLTRRSEWQRRQNMLSYTYCLRSCTKEHGYRSMVVIAHFLYFAAYIASVQLHYQIDGVQNELTDKYLVCAQSKCNTAMPLLSLPTTFMS